MSDLLIPVDFEGNIPQLPTALCQWLLKNGLPNEIVSALQGKVFI